MAEPPENGVRTVVFLTEVDFNRIVNISIYYFIWKFILFIGHQMSPTKQPKMPQVKEEAGDEEPSNGIPVENGHATSEDITTTDDPTTNDESINDVPSTETNGTAEEAEED